MNRVNYQKELEKLLDSLDREKDPRGKKEAASPARLLRSLQQLCAGVSER